MAEILRGSECFGVSAAVFHHLPKDIDGLIRTAQGSIDAHDSVIADLKRAMSAHDKVHDEKFNNALTRVIWSANDALTKKQRIESKAHDLKTWLSGADALHITRIIFKRTSLRNWTKNHQAAGTHSKEQLMVDALGWLGIDVKPKHITSDLSDYSIDDCLSDPMDWPEERELQLIVEWPDAATASNVRNVWNVKASTL